MNNATALADPGSMETTKRLGRPRIDTEPTGVIKRCSRCRREMDLCQWSPAYRAKPSAPCRDCATQLSASRASRHRDLVRRYARQHRERHHPPPPPPPVCQPGHEIAKTPVMGLEYCATCRAAKKRASFREQWAQIKADPVQLEEAAMRSEGSRPPGVPVRVRRAPGLSSRAEFVLRHCGQKMLWHGSQTSWTGKPGAGTERHHTRFVCGVCAARVSIELVEFA